MRKPTKEEENYITENLRYDHETGYLWWIKPSENKSARRLLDKPVGWHTPAGYLEFGSPRQITGYSYTKKLFVHRIAWFLHYGIWPEHELDHINNDKTDNRLENLRPATRKENGRNRKAHKDSSSKYKGVSWNKKQQKWISQIKINYKTEYLGCYTSEEDAARAYDKAARELHGEYACLNFPDEHEQGALHGHDL